MSAAAVKGSGSRLRKVECSTCGCIARMSRAAMARSGVPFCGCGVGRMMVSDVEDAARVLPADELATHPDYVAERELEVRRAIRDSRGATGNRLHCGGCHAFIPATNHDCSCGFANDIRSGRNQGRWVSGASFCPEFRRDQDMPF